MGFDHDDIAAAIAATQSNQLDIVMDFLLTNPSPTPPPSSAPPSSSPQASPIEQASPSATLDTPVPASDDNSPVPGLVDSPGTPGDSASASPSSSPDSGAVGGDRGGEDQSEYNIPALVDESDSDQEEDNRNGRYTSAATATPLVIIRRHRSECYA